MTDANTWHREVLLRTLAYPEITPEARERNLATLERLNRESSGFAPSNEVENRYTPRRVPVSERCTDVREVRGRATRCALPANHPEQEHF